jgi:DNA-binding CsgD family transcriptional regulator
MFRETEGEISMWPSPPAAEKWALSATRPPPSGVRRAGSKRQGSRWTVTKEFVRDGFCYRLIRRPLDAEDAGPRLTKREEEALACACNGYSNKRIAQCLDVAPSTVGVLLFRASAKFGVKSRRELVAAYQRLQAARASNVTPFDRSRLQKSK